MEKIESVEYSAALAITRAISALQILSRLFGKLVYDQLYNFLISNEMLFLRQSSFRKLRSVLTCLLKCTNDRYLNMDSGQYTLVTFIDLKKAFDTVNHDILLKRFLIVWCEK